MKFWVRRTSSSWSEKEKPCNGAIQERALITHHGSARSLEETKSDSWRGKAWFWDKDRINQRKTPGGVACDSWNDLWSIEIDSIDALMRFTQKEGRIIIEDTDDIYGKGPQIEIYDGYRE